MFHVIKMAALALAAALVATPVSAQDRCAAPEPVCAARAGVFVIHGFDPFASAVRVGPDLLVTNRHVVADARTVRIEAGGGREVEGAVVPTAYDGDLILVRAPGLGDGPALSPDGASSGGDLYTVGADLGRKAVRVYPPGRILLPRAATPQARLQHGAYSQVGNSGGALVDAGGRLVGIVASGGEGRYEAIEAGEIERLKEQSGPAFEAESAAVGLANRRCTEAVEVQGPAPLFMADEVAATLVEACGASRNRQHFDLAAQALGLARRVDRSVALSEAAIARDPAAINSRLILVTTLHIAGRYAEELPHLRFLMKAIPADPAVARYAIQAGKWGGDEDLARSALALLRQHNPAQAEAAGRFLEADLPPPRRPAPE